MSASIHEIDLFILGVAAFGIALMMALFCLNDCDIEKLLFEKEEEMKKAQSLNELSVGQKVYVEGDDEKKEVVIRSIEDKLIPYIIATDNSSHSLNEGIWLTEK
ncbi:MAG: hypothetical protein IJ136_01030 [Erysipelotrichaceae bacterium]|nr:hypothetical protein [Erysipelotrichaceae bacterium]